MQLIILSVSVYTAEEEVEARKRIGANAKLTVSQEIKVNSNTQMRLKHRRPPRNTVQGKLTEEGTALKEGRLK